MGFLRKKIEWTQDLIVEDMANLGLEEFISNYDEVEASA